MSFDVLADNGLLVGARDVVPFDAVAVKVVEDGQTSLFFAALAALAVIGLANAVAAKKKATCFSHATKKYSPFGFVTLR